MIDRIAMMARAGSRQPALIPLTEDQQGTGTRDIVVPPGYRFVDVHAQGGGGNGSNASASNGGGGGGGGGFARVIGATVTAGETIRLDVSASGVSTVTRLATSEAAAGNAGQQGAQPTGGNGGTAFNSWATGTPTLQTGQAGDSGLAVPPRWGGTGGVAGAALAGDNTYPSPPGPGAVTTNGSGGGAPTGGAGGGGGASNTGGAGTGGAGVCWIVLRSH